MSHCPGKAALFVGLRHSVLAAAVFHGTLNAVAGLPLLAAQGGSDLTAGLTGLPGLIVLLAANLALAAVLPRLAAPAAATPCTFAPKGD